MIVNRMTVSLDETVIAVLYRMQEDQAQITAHELAPYFSIIKKLGKEDGQAMDEVVSRQGLN